MAYAYYEHTIETTCNNGKTYQVKRYTKDGNWQEPYYSSDCKCVATEKLTTEKQYIYLGDYQVMVLGKLYSISEVHTGMYVIDKQAWLDAAKANNWDESLTNAAKEWDWDEQIEYGYADESDGNEYVVLDPGGQLEAQEEKNGYTYPVDIEEDLPELPWGYVNWDLSNVGNG